MTITRTVYDTQQLLGVIRDEDMMEPPSNFWLSSCFGTTVQFEDEFIDFQKMQGSRKIAPLVVPTAQGVPIYSAAEASYRVKPAYLKPKDTVSASRVITRAAGFGELHGDAAAMSPQARYDAIVADILREHRTAIERRWEWMAAEAIAKGTVTLEDDNYPLTVIDFQRDAGHTVALVGTDLWSDAASTPLADIQSWKLTARRAKHGGSLTTWVMGVDAYEAFRNHADVKELLNTELTEMARSGLNVPLGVMEGLDIEWGGNINGVSNIWVYNDYYENEAGTIVPFIGSKEVIAFGPNVRGVRAFGAIQDKKAGWAALPIFPKMWDQEDPSATFVMTQSAPLMVPLNPNATFKATVLT